MSDRLERKAAKLMAKAEKLDSKGYGDKAQELYHKAAKILEKCR